MVLLPLPASRNIRAVTLMTVIIFIIVTVLPTPSPALHLSLATPTAARIRGAVKLGTAARRLRQPPRRRHLRLQRRAAPDLCETPTPYFVPGPRTTPNLSPIFAALIPLGGVVLLRRLFRRHAPPMAMLSVTTDTGGSSSRLLTAAVAQISTWSARAASYFRLPHEPETVHDTPGTPTSQWLRACPTLHEGYRPTFWCTNPHLQTILASLFRRKAPVSYHREFLAVSDNGTIALDWTAPPDVVQAAVANRTPIVIILHGVTGGSRESNTTQLAAEMSGKGWIAVAFNQRGCGSSALTSSKAYCAASSGDCGEVVNHVYRLYPDATLFAVGISMGGNILVKYLGEAGSQAPLRAAVSVANPLDTLRCGRLLDTGFNRFTYSTTIARRLKEYVRRHSDMIPPAMAPADVLDGCRTVWEFDDRLTAPAFGFQGAVDYYRSAASCHVLHSVAIPLLCINAKDDPFAPGDPDYAADASPDVAFVITARGGHLAWLDGLWPFEGRNWSDRLASEFLTRALPY